MRKNQELVSIFVLLLCFSTYAFANLVFDGVFFQKAYRITSGGPQNEGGTNDDGGVIHVHIRNIGPNAQYFYGDPGAMVKLNGTYLNSVSGYQWARFWPKASNPGETVTLTIKGIQSPIAAWQNPRFEIWSDQGVYMDFYATLHDHPIKIGNAIPKLDTAQLYIFVRNEDPSWYYDIQQVWVGGTDVTANCTYVGGAGVAVNDVKIIKVQYTSYWDLYTLKPTPIRVRVRKGDGYTFDIGSFLRLTEASFQLGSWSGDLHSTDTKLIEARSQFMHDTVMPSFNWDWAKRSTRYSCRMCPMPPNTPPYSASEVLDKMYCPNVYGWYVDDEPELANKTAAALKEATMNVWDNDWLHPTIINNAKNKFFQRFGAAVDHPCYDHYAQYAPLCYGSFGTTYSIKNSFWYADSLKRNCEPLRLWSYSQGVSTTTGWRGQPTTWGIKVQFWNQIMAGIKGIQWFFAKDESGYTNQYNSIRQVIRELSMVKSIILYSDVARRVNVSHSDMLSQMLVGEDAVVVVVTNSSGYYTNGILASVGMTDRNNQSISFEVPWSITIQQVKEVRQDGLYTPTYSVGGNTVTITGLNLTQTTPHRVFLIGKNDTVAPGAPLELNIPTWEGTTAVLTWKEPYDNYGVKGYRVYRDGTQIADVNVPLYKVTNASVSSTYTVHAYDAAGNLGPASTVCDQAAPTWNFNAFRNFEAWTPFSVFRPTATEWGAVMYWTRADGQPNLFSPAVRVNTATRKNVEIQYYNRSSGTQACLYWTTDGTTYHGKWFNLAYDTWTSVVLNMNNEPNWTGTIIEFRLDLPGYNQQNWQDMYIDSFKVY